MLASIGSRVFKPALPARDGFAAIPVTALDPPHSAASPTVPALDGSGSPAEIITTTARKVVAGQRQVLFGQTRRQAARVRSKLKVCITSNIYVSSLLWHVTFVVGLAGGLRAASGRNIGLAQLNVCKPPVILPL